MKNAVAGAVVAVIGMLLVVTGYAQEPVKVFVEEVRIPISAKDANGHFDPTLESSDPRGAATW